MGRRKKDIIEEAIKSVEEEQANKDDNTIEMNAEKDVKVRRKRAVKYKEEDLASLKNQLVFLYSVINNVLATRIQEFSTITQEENEKLAESTLNLMKEYGIKISSKYNALLTFIMTHASVYGFRVYMHIQTEKMKKQYEGENQNN